MRQYGKKKLFQVILFVVFADSVSLSWSSSINSIFTTRSLIPTSVMSAELIESITTGAQIAFEQCQKAFKWDRWNCPENTFARRYQKTATKELAYARAIMSAGIVHTITRNCSKGEIEGCGCDPEMSINQVSFNKISGPKIDQNSNLSLLKNLEDKEEIQWSWGGCSDHVNYGLKVTKKYLDDLENANPQDPHSFVHLHNNKLGRQIVKETMVKRCICHGVSGSCALQTCWMQVAPFQVIARKLKEKYHKSKRVETMNKSNVAREDADRLFMIHSEDIRHEMIYLEESPDYCVPDNATGWKGTKGRTCSRTGKDEEVSFEEKKSCRNICRVCGHKVRKQKRVISERCNCKFKWCCEVECEICRKTVEEFYCQ